MARRVRRDPPPSRTCVPRVASSSGRVVGAPAAGTRPKCMYGCGGMVVEVMCDGEEDTWVVRGGGGLEEPRRGDHGLLEFNEKRDDTKKGGN